MKNKNIFLGFLALFLAIMFIAHRGPTEVAPPAPFSEPVIAFVDAQDALYEQVREQVAPSVFKIVSGTMFRISIPSGVVTAQCPVISGSGFFVTRDGHGITAAHVIDMTEDDKACFETVKANLNEKKIPFSEVKRISITNAILADGRTLQMVVLAATSPENEDLALVQVAMPKGETIRPLAFSNATDLSDQTVAVVGAPFGIANLISTGKIGRAELHNGQYRLVVAPVYPGNSGGPVILLRDFRVVGIIDKVVVQGDAATNIAYAVPANVVVEFLHAHLPIYVF